VKPADQLKPIEMLLDRGFGGSPQLLDIAHNVSSRPLEHLSDETLRLLVENVRQCIVRGTPEDPTCRAISLN